MPAHVGVCSDYPVMLLLLVTHLKKIFSCVCALMLRAAVEISNLSTDAEICVSSSPLLLD